MLYLFAFLPLVHGQAGILDELLLFGAPLVVVIIILVMARRRVRKNATPRERAPRENIQPPHPPEN
jgi:hypothetical protein